jgi:Dolichyl-phosphate-mannose-protein mannosyltransferase
VARVPAIHWIERQGQSVAVFIKENQVLVPDAPRIVAWLEKRRYLVLILLTAMYLVGTAGRARGRPFWYDEVITLIAANSPDLATTWKRVTIATDATPPLSHLLTHLSIRWFGLNEFTGRLPAMAGFWVMCLCLFQFVQRRKGVVYGLSALLLPMLTGAYFYATEARGYGLELAFLGLALVAWQFAAEGRCRAVALPALAASLGCMLMCHYYGVLAYLPLAGGDAMRLRRTRRPDWGVWIALAVGGLPLAWRLATIVDVVKGSSHTWSPAYLRQGLEFWESGLAPGAAYAALFVGLVALVGRRPPVAANVDDSVPAHEWVAGALLMATPLVAVIGGLLVTHTFTGRYALSGLVGFCLLTPLVAAEFFGRRGAAGVVLLGVLVWGTTIRLMDYQVKGNPLESEPVLKEALEKGPVVISDGLVFLQMWYYAPERLKPRLVFLTNEAAAVKYMGYDTIDSGIRAMRQWVPIQVTDYSEFAKPGKEFLVYQGAVIPGWVLPQVMADGASAGIRQVALFQELVSVRMPGKTSEFRPDGQAGGLSH